METRDFAAMFFHTTRTFLLAVIKIIFVVLSWVLHLIGSLLLWLSSLITNIIKPWKL